MAFGLASGLALGCGALLGIHDVERDGAGAQGGAGAGGGDGGGGGQQAQYSLSLSDAAPRVVRGSSVDLTVTVTREPGFTGAVDLSIVDLPTGVTAGTATVAAEASTGVLTLTAGPQASLGAADASLVASAEGLADRSVPVAVLIADPPGTLDQTFDADGITIAAATGSAHAMAVQPDDRIVVAGLDGSTWVIARYLPGGALDPGFGAGGVVTDIDGTLDDIALQPDGKILVVGQTTGTHAVVARYNQDGSRDQAFGANGLAALDGSVFSSSRGYGVAVQSTGAVVMVGTESPDNNGFILRFSPSGQRDLGFPAAGLVSAADQAYHTVAVGAGDSLVVGGTSSLGIGPTFMAARFDSEGAVDPGFGGAGVALLGPTPFNDSGLALQQDGKPVLSGKRLDGVNGLAFARFTADGLSDATFGAGGLVDPQDVNYESTHDVALAADGKLLGVTTSGTVASGLVAAILRRLQDGSPDPGFGAAGKVLFDSGSIPSYLRAVAVQRDGRIVAAGSRGSADLMVVRVWD